MGMRLGGLGDAPMPATGCAPDQIEVATIDPQGKMIKESREKSRKLRASERHRIHYNRRVWASLFPEEKRRIEAQEDRSVANGSLTAAEVRRWRQERGS